MKIEGISKSYKIKGGEVRAVTDVSLELPEKGLVLIAGKSGSGKSTLLNILGGLERADSGKIHTDGIEVTALSGKELDIYRGEYCGIVFQEYNLLPELSVGENIGLSLEIRGGKASAEEISEALKSVELEGYEKRKVTALSGGQKQRVAIAAAVIKKPRLILADEPTGALDGETGENIIKILKSMSKDSLVILVSHDRELTEKYADRVIVMSEGGIESDSGENTAKNSESEEFRLEKTRAGIPIKAAIKIGCGNFKSHPVRLLATILLAVIAFTLFAISFSLLINDKNAIAVKTLVGNGITESPVSKSFGEIDVKFNDGDYKLFNEKTHSGAFLTVSAELDIENGNESIYSSVIPNAVTCLTEEKVALFGYRLYGALPKGNLEVAITKFDAEILFENKSPDEIAGSVLSIGGEDFHITGVVDTNFDGSPFEKLKSAYGEEEEALTREFYTALGNGCHNSLIVNDIGRFTVKDEAYFRDQIAEFVSGQAIGAERVLKLDGDAEIVKLTDDVSEGFILSAYNIPMALRGYGKADLFDKLYSEYIEENLSEMYQEALRSGFSGSEAQYSELLRSGSRNPYGESRSSIFIKIYKANADVLPKKIEIEMMNGSVSTGKYVIAGFCDADLPQGAIFAGDKLFAKLYERAGYYDGLNVSLDLDKKEIAELISFYGDGKFSYRLNNVAVKTVEEVFSNMEFIREIIGYLSVVFAVLACLLLAYYLNQSVYDRRKTIGILNALGCGKAGIFKIFVLECLIVCLAVFALSAAIGGIASALINSLTAGGTKLKLYLSSFGFGTVFTLFGAVFIFALIGLVTAVIGITHCKPIDNIEKD